MGSIHGEQNSGTGRTLGPDFGAKESFPSHFEGNEARKLSPFVERLPQVMRFDFCSVATSVASGACCF